jgi:tripartite-type tricarboxylate transporter receptor subunit TctC
MRPIIHLAASFALALTAAFGVSSSSLAQDYPKRLVRIVVPYPAGGGVDALARPLAEELAKKWQQPVIVENKPGASTQIGGEYVAKSEADGHALFLTSDSSITSNPHLFKKSNLNPITELAPVTQLIDLHQMVVVHPSVPVNSIKELVALAKSKPSSLNYGSYGNGSQPHLLFEMLRVETGAQIMQIPYRGIAPAITATIANDVQMTLGGAATTGAYYKAGRLKALAISRTARLSAYPEVPTLAEAGFPGVDPKSWFGLFATAGTPKEVIQKIQKSVAEIFSDPQFRDRHIESAGYTAVASTPEDFAKFIQTDLAYKGHLIATAGIKAE